MRANIRFNVGKVQRPLASAAKVVEQGNRIVLQAGRSYIENEKTKERIGLRLGRGTYIFDIKLMSGKRGQTTLDSGAGVNVWPHSKLREVPTQPPDPNLRMRAANGEEIPNLGIKEVEFEPGPGDAVFSRLAVQGR